MEQAEGSPRRREVASGRIEAGILDEHRDGTGNLQMTITLLRWAAALAGRRAQCPSALVPWRI